MASIVERPLWGVFRRPVSETGFWSWVTTVDHKRIGILYFWTALAFFLIGGLEAILIRLQLATPGQNVVSADAFNQLFTMHATTMIFLAVMPLSAAFFNFLVPLQIGARDVAFPKLNAYSYWMFLFGGIFLNSSWLLGGASDAGWFGYPNLSTADFNPGHGVDFWILGLLLSGIGTLVAAFNFIVTILNMRAPGMTLMRMPVFAWATLITSFLIIFAFPVITVAFILLLLDRMFGTVFFNVVAGADVVLYQHLFWIFGHPEVYIIILPAMGMVSEILPTFSRKPLFGYPVMIFSMILIGFVGFAVWSHHMFTVGMGSVVNTVFALATMVIAVPTGVKMFNWIGTLWGGRLRFTTAMLFALGFLALFLIGGLTGVMLAAAPANAQLHDTYFVVAHFHYVMIGGALFSLMGAIYFWAPKMFGRMLDETMGKVNFWLMFIGFNLTFFPMHFLAALGMPRRIYTYSPGMGWELWNLVSTLGALTMSMGVVLMLYNLFRSLRHGEIAAADPWDGRTLEWAIPSPPPDYNFARIPVVQSRDDLWVRKYGAGHDEEHVEAQTAAAAENDGHADRARGHEVEGHEVHADRSHGHGAGGRDNTGRDNPGHRNPGHDNPGRDEHGIHMPGATYMPVILSLGLFIASYGLLYSLAVALLGLALALVGLFGWAFEGEGGKIIYPEGDRA